MGPAWWPRRGGRPLALHQSCFADTEDLGFEFRYEGASLHSTMRARCYTAHAMRSSVARAVLCGPMKP